MKVFAIALFACLYAVESVDNESNKTATAIDQREACKIKRSCVECLRLVHCSWCNTEEKCFSNELEPQKCSDSNTSEYEDYGFSLQDNARCSCNPDEIVGPNCWPEGADREQAPCSGRGKCVCGRCICKTYETYENSTKIIMGDYCEFDNFSCDGPGCNEGPYPYTPPSDNNEEFF